MEAAAGAGNNETGQGAAFVTAGFGMLGLRIAGLPSYVHCYR